MGSLDEAESRVASEGAPGPNGIVLATMSRTSQRQDGDQVTRVQTLFVHHSPAVRGFILALLPDFSAVDDVLQETFLTVTAKAAEFEPGSSFLRWACAIARFKVIEYAHKSARCHQAFAPEVIESLSACEPPDDDQTELRITLLTECLGQLAPQARRVVELRYQQAHKPAEVATLMGWSAGAVYVALSRARSVLRECVERKINQQI